jgi:UTP:GlnB (protein PII) uridylyltransferase
VAEKTSDPSDSIAPSTTKIVVAEDEDTVIIGIDALDRDGLLLDISKAMSRLDLSLQKSESVVKGNRSVSLWFVQKNKQSPLDIGEIWTVLEVSFVR